MGQNVTDLSRWRNLEGQKGKMNPSLLGSYSKSVEYCTDSWRCLQRGRAWYRVWYIGYPPPPGLVIRTLLSPVQQAPKQDIEQKVVGMIELWVIEESSSS